MQGLLSATSGGEDGNIRLAVRLAELLSGSEEHSNPLVIRSIQSLSLG